MAHDNSALVVFTDIQTVSQPGCTTQPRFAVPTDVDRNRNFRSRT